MNLTIISRLSRTVLSSLGQDSTFRLSRVTTFLIVVRMKSFFLCGRKVVIVSVIFILRVYILSILHISWSFSMGFITGYIVIWSLTIAATLLISFNVWNYGLSELFSTFPFRKWLFAFFLLKIMVLIVVIITETTLHVSKIVLYYIYFVGDNSREILHLLLVLSRFTEEIVAFLELIWGNRRLYRLLGRC